jgi:hypothetical protein
MWRAQGRQHGLERVVQRQQVGDAAAGAQHQHLLALQSVLRQQIQEGLEHAAVGGLVDGGGHDDHVGGLHGLDSGDQRGVAEFGPQNGLGGQVGHLDQAAVTAGGLQLGQGLAQQRRGTGGAGRAARNADDVHGEVRVVRSTGLHLSQPLDRDQRRKSVLDIRSARSGARTLHPRRGRGWISCRGSARKRQAPETANDQ